MNDAPLRLVVFDVDGTLLDSHDAISGVMRSVFQDAGMTPPSAAAVSRIVGLELTEAVARLAPSASAAEVDALASAYRGRFEVERASGGGEGSMPLFPGARAALDRIWATPTLMGVATGKGRPGLERFLDGHELRPLFATARCGGDAPGKPHPGMLEQCLDETGVDAAQAVMIGDTTYDMEMAANAGVAAIGVDWGHHAAAELRDAGAETVLAAFEALDAALDALWGQDWRR